MSEQRSDQASIKPKVWLGISVGIFTQLGLKTFLPIVLLVLIRMLSLETDDNALWLEQSADASHPVWYALQVAVFLGSVLAGVLASLLSPRRSLIVPTVLIGLSLLATAFEQLPHPVSPAVVIVWALGPCFGLLLGFILVRAFWQRNA